jgi:GNAT superfamily N-acetyltransferase
VEKVRIAAWDGSDELISRALYQVTQAVAAVDDPFGPPMSERTGRALLKSPGEPAQAWFVPGDAPGSARGFYHLRLPVRENRHLGGFYLQVHPEHRHRGIGLALLRHAAQRAAQDGRSVLVTGVFQGSAGEAFARWLGAKPGIADARRVQVLGKLPAAQVAALRESAAAAAADYSLVTWTDRTPDEYLPGLATVFNAMGDAPRDPGHEARIWDAELIRERVDDPRDLFGSRGYFVAAVHEQTGDMAAVSQVEVDPEYPEWAHQQITAVAGPHRGHRLGLLVKAAMTEWIGTAEPALRRIVTWNATANKHMIAINEALGYELLDPQSRDYELPVEAVVG